MELEEKKVLLNRNIFNVLFKEWRSKEWWYTGAYDPKSGVYFSWFFVRVNLLDKVCVTVFDPSLEKALLFTQMLWLDKKQVPGSLSLNYNKGGVSIGYNGNEKDGWEFKLKSKGFNAEVSVKPTIDWFTKFDNEIVETYGLLHFFHNLATGTFEAGGKKYEFKNALSYYDHCFGRIPSNTGWHWLAVQNKDIAIASLVNYGPYAQRYTQAWFTKKTKSPRKEEWVRLEQSVSFEREHRHNWVEPWLVSSSDVELEVSLIQRTTEKTCIPPFFGFIIDLRHTEVYIKAKGRIRVDGKWMETGDMFGVMEEHYGKW
ncbi:MAG: hypothetical protein GY754_16440 [bacterium]|nr:hypothetical protein [bacterium]